MKRLAPLLALLALAGCGDETLGELPPAAGPARSPRLTSAPAGRTTPLPGRPVRARRPREVTVEDGRQVVRLSPRERLVATYDARTRRRTGRAYAGVGPTHVVSDGGRLLYVADTAGDGLVVLHTRPRLEVTRRVAFPGGAPYGLAIDRRRHRIWVTLTATNEVVELRANARPGIVRRFPAVRQPDAVAVDDRTGRVFVTGVADRVLQRFDPPRRSR